jgi:hypothetical protein
MLDMISRATGKDDKNIRKVSCVTNELVDNHRHDGKIYMKLYNMYHVIMKVIGLT